MGLEQRTVTVTGLLSDHGSEQDDLDEAAWEDLCGKVRELTARPEYEAIQPMVAT